MTLGFFCILHFKISKLRDFINLSSSDNEFRRGYTFV